MRRNVGNTCRSRWATDAGRAVESQEASPTRGFLLGEVIPVRHSREALAGDHIGSLKGRHLYAPALLGFSGAFALFLLLELRQDSGGLLASGLNLTAAVALIVVCAVGWRHVRVPETAHLPWRLKVVIAVASVLALIARAPLIQS